jgi:hypothetical protein
MVRPDGQVRLIDFTFVRPPNTAAGTVLVFKRGYSAPEIRTGQAGLPADRYSFGAVAYYLLARAEPAIEDVPADSRAVLIRTGFSSEVADHVAALLAPNPAARPINLVEWTTQLRKLGHRESAPTRYRMVALTVDGTATPVITAGGTDGVAGVRLGVGMTWRLQADVTSPSAVTALAAVTDGSGTQASFAIDEGGTVLVGRSGQWQDQGRVVAGSGLAATRDAQGRAVAYVVDPNAHDLTTITVGLDGTTRRFATGRPPCAASWPRLPTGTAAPRCSCSLRTAASPVSARKGPAGSERAAPSTPQAASTTGASCAATESPEGSPHCPASIAAPANGS